MSLTVICRPAASFPFLFLFLPLRSSLLDCAPTPFAASSCSLTILWTVLLACFAIYLLCPSPCPCPTPFHSTANMCDADSCSSLPLAPLQGQSKVSSAPLCTEGPWQWFLLHRSTASPLIHISHLHLAKNSGGWKATATECRKLFCLIAASKLMTATVCLYLCLNVLSYTEKTWQYNLIQYLNRTNIT